MSEPRQLVGMVVAGQQFGLRIDAVRHILGFQRLAKVPLAAAEIAGLLNLRGRIVTAIDLARRLRIERGRALPADQAMHIVVDRRGQLYSLLVDRVGEVLTLGEARFEADSGSLPAAWRPLAHGIFCLDEALLVELDIERVLDLQPVG
jgi:purine-binding chemotaxis protein CheW